MEKFLLICIAFLFLMILIASKDHDSVYAIGYKKDTFTRVRIDKYEYPEFTAKMERTFKDIKIERVNKLNYHFLGIPLYRKMYLSFENKK
jgi:hypothetical protein